MQTQQQLAELNDLDDLAIKVFSRTMEAAADVGVALFYKRIVKADVHWNITLPSQTHSFDIYHDNGQYRVAFKTYAASNGFSNIPIDQYTADKIGYLAAFYFLLTKGPVNMPKLIEKFPNLPLEERQALDPVLEKLSKFFSSQI